MIRDKDKILKESLHNYTDAMFEVLDFSRNYHDTFDSLIGDVFPRNDELERTEYPLTDIPPAIEYRDAINKHPDIGPQLNNWIGAANAGTYITCWGVFRQFVFALIDRQKGFQFDEEIFSSLFDEMLAFFRSTTLSTQIVYLLENFASREKKIELEDGWIIQEVPEEIRKNLGDVKEKPHSALPNSFLWVEFVLTKEFSATRLVGLDQIENDTDSTLADLRKEKDHIISALRIMKSGGIICRSEIHRSMAWHIGPPDQKEVRWNSYIPIDTGLKYELQSTDRMELIDIFQSLKKVKKNASFQTSLRRLNYASERIDFHRQDQILDYMIAFESLLLLRNESELKYRMGLRCATLIGESSTERSDIKDNFGFAYNLRSSIIHGDSEEDIKKLLSKRNYSFSTFTEYLGDLLRKSMKVYLQEAKSKNNHQQIIKILEDRILNDISLKGVESISYQNLNNEEILEKLVKYGGSPEKVVELLRTRGLLQDQEMGNDSITVHKVKVDPKK